jgi:hypothetical protein
LEICQAELGWDTGIANSAGGAPGVLVRFAVVDFVVRGASVTNHGHDVWEDDARAVVLVGVDEDTEAFEVVGTAKDGAGLGALTSEPHGHAVAVKVAVAMNVELDFNLPERQNLANREEFVDAAYLPIRRSQWYAREDPSISRRPIWCQADISVCQSVPYILEKPTRALLLIRAHNRISSKVPPSTREIRIHIWLVMRLAHGFRNRVAPDVLGSRYGS